MSKEVVVSLGRVAADQVAVEPGEAYAVLQHVWQHLRASRDDDGGVVVLPALDVMGITAFGDFEFRRGAATAPRSVRPPHVLTHELATLLLKLLASGRTDFAGVPRTCIEIARRALPGVPALSRPIVTPEALFRALEAYRPRDASGTLGALFARWRRTTDPTHAGTWDGAVAANQDAVEAPAALPVRRPPHAVSAPVASPFHPPADPTAVVVSGDARGPRWPIHAAVAALLCFVLLGGVSAWRWVNAPAPGVVVETAAHEGTVIAIPAEDGAGDAATPMEPSGRSGDAPPSAAPRARRLLHADRSGRVPYSPSFAPRGDAIVFHAGIEDTALLEATLGSDGRVRDVSTVLEEGARSYHAQVSPDGRWLAYDSDVDGTRGVYIAARDGSSPQRVSGPGQASVPSWSPDGRRLAFARAEPGRPRVWNVWTLDVATGRLQRRTSHTVGQPWGASWFPDGTRIAYSHEDRLIVLDLQTGASQTYPTPVGGRVVRTPAVSPDGTRIVFQVRHDGTWVLDLPTGDTRRVLGDASAQEFAWSPDGRRVVYHSVRGGTWGIWMLELEPEFGP